MREESSCKLKQKCQPTENCFYKKKKLPFFWSKNHLPGISWKATFVDESPNQIICANFRQARMSVMACVLYHTWLYVATLQSQFTKEKQCTQPGQKRSHTNMLLDHLKHFVFHCFKKVQCNVWIYFSPDIAGVYNNNTTQKLPNQSWRSSNNILVWEGFFCVVGTVLFFDRLHIFQFTSWTNFSVPEHSGDAFL